MKKFFLYCMTALLALGASSCKDDEVMGSIDPTDLSRMPRTQFRQLETTNKDENADPFATHIITEEFNAIHLAWYGIENAAGYEIRYGVHSGLYVDNTGDESKWEGDAVEGALVFLTDPNANVADWKNLNNIANTTFFKAEKEGQEMLSYDLRHLQYGTTYLFAIRVLHPDGNPEHHSKWYGFCSQREWAQMARYETKERYSTPEAITDVVIGEDRKSFTVYIDLNVNKNCNFLTSTYSNKTDIMNLIGNHFDFIQDGTEGDYETAKVYFDQLRVLPSTSTPDATVDGAFKAYDFDPTSFVDGKGSITVTGLSQNAIYNVDLINTKKTDVPEVDRLANSIRKAVYGDPGEPILIKHYVHNYDSVDGEMKYEAMCLDGIIGDFANNVKLAEGQTFYLEGGKNYFFHTNPTLCKGFVLETNPADVAAGKRATVFLGGIGYSKNEEGGLTTNIQSCNFMFGKVRESGEPDAPIEVGEVIFNNLDFDCPLATNFGSGAATGNYFANMYSTGMAVTFKAFEAHNCTFKNMIRGFIRTQGSKFKIFDRIVIDNCLFWDNGYYDTTGRGYAWFAGDGGQTTSNIYKHLEFTNNTIYDSPRTAFFTDNDKNIEYDPSVQWNIICENNTFINFSTRSTGRNFFQMRYIPGGSHISFQRNLIVLAADDKDVRPLDQYGADIREVKGSGMFSFTIKDNYSVGCREAHMVDDGIFSASQSFCRTSNSFGTTTWVPGNTGTKDDMIVKALKDDNGNVMKSTDLFVNPNPRNTAYDASKPTPEDHIGPANIYEDLKYKVTPSIITTKNIGDPRWRK